MSFNCRLSVLALRPHEDPFEREKERPRVFQPGQKLALVSIAKLGEELLRQTLLVDRSAAVV